jgi:SPP1 gp7 family putative phage head morphogenesis protein
MSELYRRAAEHRARLLARDAETLAQIEAAYREVEATITKHLSVLLARIEEARASGEVVSEAWLLRRGRLDILLQQAEERIAAFGGQVAGIVTAAQRRATIEGAADAFNLFSVAAAPLPPARRLALLATFARLPQEAIEALIGFMGDGTPLARRLEALPSVPNGAALSPVAAIRSALLRAVALGENPRQTARRVRKAADIARSDALRIARTETLRAYREATRLTYLANSNILAGWRWVAALQSRTCPACLALHGRIFPLNDPMGNHPNCRCVMVPVLKDWPQDPPQGAEEWLRRQSVAVQNNVFGIAAAKAWRAGEVSLSDFVHEERSAAWGVTFSTASVSEAKGRAGGRKGSFRVLP